MRSCQPHSRIHPCLAEAGPSSARFRLCMDGERRWNARGAPGAVEAALRGRPPSSHPCKAVHRCLDRARRVCRPQLGALSHEAWRGFGVHGLSRVPLLRARSRPSAPAGVAVSRRIVRVLSVRWLRGNPGQTIPLGRTTASCRRRSRAQGTVCHTPLPSRRKWLGAGS